jgi:uncharacterized LabA/DUF88 family protein
MLIEPQVKRVVAFIDGQNLFHAVREAFGFIFPNYEVVKLATAVCQLQGWSLTQTRFYTGVPDRSDDAFWNHFWTAKLAAMGRHGVSVYSRLLRYRNKKFELPGRGEHTFLVGEEKGIDVRIAVDTIRLAHRKVYDVALIFSQDQDFTEVAEEIRVIAQEQNRWLKIACAFPSSPTSKNRRGINKTDWIRVDRTTYDACIDPRDYRVKTQTP